MAEAFHWKVGVKVSENKSEDFLIDAERMCVEENYAVFWIGEKISGIVNLDNLIYCKCQFYTGSV